MDSSWELQTQCKELQKQSVELRLWHCNDHCNDAIDRCGRLPNAWPLCLCLLHFLSVRPTPDVVSCSSSIRSCSANFHWRKSIQLLQHMARVQVNPDQISSLTGESDTFFLSRGSRLGDEYVQFSMSHCVWLHASFGSRLRC